ncbi:MAG: hypothetical protein HS108_10320 [Planctomycetes bacterium]|nr:hypothetical protein [Planctomycetota bacterium]MCL4729323.1 hypothetical protein [Planctomycetota bacterium]
MLAGPAPLPTMPEEIPFPSGFEALREPMRKLDALLAIARRVQLESGKVPPGLLEDFHDVRRQLEKAFVFNFRGVDERLQDGLRKFLKNTRNAGIEQLDRNLERLCKVSHSMLNALMIQGAPTLSLEDDLADAPALQATAAVPAPAAPATAPRVSEPRRGHGLFVALAIALVAVLTVVIGWATGLFTPVPAANNAPPVAVNRPPVNVPANRPVEPVDTSRPFDPAAAGYPQLLALYPLDTSVDPLRTPPELLLPDDLPGVLLGMEEALALLEPGRLRSTPDQTRAALRAFGQDVIDSQPAWKESRKPFLDAYAAHVRKRLNLALYEDAPGTVLVSDVLFRAGGGQQSLCATLQVLALCARAPVGLYAPNGIARPMIGVLMRDGVHTFNGEQYGLRTGNVPLARVSELVVELCVRLLPTLEQPAARLWCLGVVRNLAGALSVELARRALADIDLAWLADPGTDAPPEAVLRHELARTLQPVVCNALLYDLAGATAAEALALYRLAAGAGDEAAVKQALLLLGKRAEKGALLDGQPLALRVGDLLRDMNKPQEAAAWYLRALEDHPDDPRPALRLAALQPGSKLAHLREAYARGERAATVMLELAGALSAARDDLAALAVLDQLCLAEPHPVHLQAAVLVCLALERPDWAQQRLARQPEVKSPELTRLDLICELQRFGLSDRARELAKTWRATGGADPFVEGLLKRYGG